MSCQKGHKLKDLVVSFFGGGGSILFLINRHCVVLEIQLNPFHRDRCPAHISGDGFNAIHMTPVYFLFSMDLKVGGHPRRVMIPGH